MNALIDHPEQIAKLQANLDDDADLMDGRRTRSCAGSSPVLALPADGDRDIELRGKQIRKGDKVLMWHVSANRDEEVFDDPFRST